MCSTVTGRSFAFFSYTYNYIPAPCVLGQLWSLTTATLQARIRTQLNTSLFAKTLVRKDIASSSSSSSSNPATASPDTPPPQSDAATQQKEKEDEFSSKAQIMTLMCAFSLQLI
jgi:hypothetical protein